MESTVNTLTVTHAVITRQAQLSGRTSTNGQHAFYQLIHRVVLKWCRDLFIAPAITITRYPIITVKLLSNFFAQTEALAFGKSREVVGLRAGISRSG